MVMKNVLPSTRPHNEIKQVGAWVKMGLCNFTWCCTVHHAIFMPDQIGSMKPEVRGTERNKKKGEDAASATSQAMQPRGSCVEVLVVLQRWL